MEQSRANPLVRLAAEHAHEGHALSTIEIHGIPTWLASQVSEALGYSRPGQVVSNITSDWSAELVEGADYQVLRGAELAALKAAAPGLVDPRAPSVMVLTETGVNLVALLSRQPKARDLRRWLASEVLPSIRRTGGYDSAQVTPRTEDHLALLLASVHEAVLHLDIPTTQKTCLTVLLNLVESPDGTIPDPTRLLARGPTLEELATWMGRPTSRRAVAKAIAALEDLCLVEVVRPGWRTWSFRLDFKAIVDRATQDRLTLPRKLEAKARDRDARREERQLLRDDSHFALVADQRGELQRDDIVSDPDPTRRQLRVRAWNARLAMLLPDDPLRGRMIEEER